MTKAETIREHQPQSETRMRPMPLDDLRLDVDNPRLASSRDVTTQEDLLQLLWGEMAVEEIALSIAANGYLKEEPLLVFFDKKKEKYVVVEGNRRLAAVLLLRDPSLRKKVVADRLPKLKVSEIEALRELPVSVYKNRQSLWKYTGFKHINGPKPWDAFSKAKYVARVHRKYGKSLEEIANTIGDTHATVVRLFRGYVLLEQAEAQGAFDREDRVKTRFAFSHLYTAAASPGFQNFLGIKSETSLRPHPVPKRKRGNLKELLVWLYGRKSTDTPPVITKQQPDLWDLEEVISNPSSLAGLRAGYSLRRAYMISAGAERRFREALTAAKEELHQASGFVIKYKGEDDLFEMIDDTMELVVALREEMDSRRHGKKKESSKTTARTRSSSSR